MDNLFSVKEAAQLGIDRMRNPIWANECDHLKIDIVDGMMGPWVRLYAPFNTECNGRDPVNMLCIQIDCDEPIFEEYTGPLPDSEEYSEAVAKIGES